MLTQRAICLLLVPILCSFSVARGQDAKSPLPNEEAIREEIDRWVRVVNSGAAEKVAELFATGGELIDETGRVVKGKDALTAFLTEYFTTFPGLKVTVVADAIRMLSPNAVVAEGSRTTTIEGQTSVTTRFSALYLKEKDRWELASWRESIDDSLMSAGQHLKPLEWMIGEWVNEQADSEIHLSCRWSEDNNFLLRDFTVLVAGTVKVKSSQRIGWDAVTKQIRSWNFDSDGGHGDGVWAGGGSRWLIRTTSALADGRSASALHSITLEGTDKLHWESTSRIIGANIEPDRQATLVRKSPEPLNE